MREALCFRRNDLDLVVKVGVFFVVDDKLQVQKAG